MRTFATVAVVLLVIVSVTGHGVMLARLRPHRVDLEPHQHYGEGRSPFWQVNVLRRRNYTPEGRRLLRWMSFFQALWMVSALGIVALVMGLI